MKVFSELSHYKGKKGGYTVRKWHKEQILEVLGTMKEAQKKGLYADCQDGALALIDFINSVVEEETRTTLLLEEYEGQRKAIYELNRTVFASIEEVPSSLIRSSLQRSIQILKRHRDIYYFRARAEDKKPISAIITTLAAQFAENVSPQITLIELLKHITEELAAYAELLQDATTRNWSVLENRTRIRRDGEKWYIPNPVNPFDNYADGWDEETANIRSKTAPIKVTPTKPWGVIL
mgnify:CR=1 FL=1